YKFEIKSAHRVLAGAPGTVCELSAAAVDVGDASVPVEQRPRLEWRETTAGVAVVASPVRGWSFAGAAADYEATRDDAVAHAGSSSGVLRARRDSQHGFASLRQEIAATPYRGRRVRVT